MIRKWKPLLILLLIPLGTGLLSALLTGGSMAVYNGLAKPPLSPPGWLFPVVWTILYLLMGLASYLIYQEYKVDSDAAVALLLYGAQLLFQFFWPILFFRLHWYFAAFVWLVILAFLIWRCIQEFAIYSKTAAKLMIPYLVWVVFAGYLNLVILILN